MRILSRNLSKSEKDSYFQLKYVRYVRGTTYTELQYVVTLDMYCVRVVYCHMYTLNYKNIINTHQEFKSHKI